MPWPKMNAPGTVTITPDGRVRVEAFDTEHASCRQACTLAMVWAVEKLSAAIMEDMTADRPVLSAID